MQSLNIIDFKRWLLLLLLDMLVSITLRSNCKRSIYLRYLLTCLYLILRDIVISIFSLIKRNRSHLRRKLLSHIHLVMCLAILVFGCSWLYYLGVDSFDFCMLMGCRRRASHVNYIDWNINYKWLYTSIRKKYHFITNTTNRYKDVSLVRVIRLL